MPSNKKNLSINSVDFDDIKTNLKSYLRSLEVFKDYDFEGSGIATLIDLLAYNTYYQAFYNNVVANEMFLDSAVKRSSVVSIAKSLGYTPHSRTAPTAFVGVTFGSNPGTTVLLPGSQFTTSINQQTYTFVNTDSADITETAGVWGIDSVAIKEGVLTSLTYIVPDASNENRYTITEPNIDISTIKVRVQTSQTDTTGINDVWSRIKDFTELNSTTNAFFIEENTRGNYDIFFGDGVLGKKPETGNLVTITYLITRGTEANGAGKNDTANNRAFRYLNAGNTVVVKAYADGGSEREPINTIRFRAPRSFATQNRAVTKNDFVSLVESNFTGFDSVFVYGGEEANPPTFGSVFVAIKPLTGTIAGEGRKQDVQSFLREKCVLGIRPVVVDPDYTYLRFAFDVSYDTKKTSLSASSLANAIRRSVTQNIDLNLGKFSQSFSISKLLSDVDKSSVSIDSSAVNVTMEKKFIGLSPQLVSYDFDFGNPIEHPHEGHMVVVYSNDFRYLDPSDNITKTVFLEDDGFGNISFFERTSQDRATKRVVAENVGSVNYKNGTMKIDSVQILSPEDKPFISLFAKASNKRYVSLRNKILINDYLEDASAIKITLNGIEQETTTTISNVGVNPLNIVTSTFVG